MTNYNCIHECYNYELCKALKNIPNDLTAFGSCNFYKDKSSVIDIPYGLSQQEVNMALLELESRKKTHTSVSLIDGHIDG